MNRALRRQQKKLAQKGGNVGGADFLQLLQQGLEYHKSGNLAAAEKHYKHALDLQPDHPEANHLLGTLVHQLGRSDLALTYLNKATAVSPGNSGFHNMAGLAYKSLGDFANAEAAYQQAINCDPKSAAAYVGLGLVFKQLGNLTEAATQTQKAIDLQPRFTEAINNLGNIYQDQGRLTDAIEVYEGAISIDPTFVPALYNYARALQQLEETERSISVYQKTLQIQPDFVDAQSNFGLALRSVGRANEAIAPLQRAAELQPTVAEHYYNLGMALTGIGQNLEAIECFEGATTIKPDFSDAHSGLGNAFIAMGRSSEAIQHFQTALVHDQTSADVHNNLGCAFVRTGDLQSAKESFATALELKTEFAEAHNNLGNLHQELGQFKLAHECFQKALLADPSYNEAYSNLLFAMNYDPSKSGEEIFEHYRAYEKRFAEPHYTQIVAHKNDVDAGRRLKVGYVAPSFHKHAVSYFMMPLFDLANRTDFEVFAYADLTKSDSYTDQYRSNCDHFILTTGMTDEALANRIREDEIDILVDIAGHAKGNRLEVFARKPAPVSLHWLDFGYTTGIREIDYYVGDEVITPPKHDHLFGEKEVWRLDGFGAVYRPGDGMGDVSKLPALSNGYITFCSLSRSVRLNDKTVRVWAEILKAIPTSKLRVDSRNFATKMMCDALIARFAKYGVASERLILGFQTPPWDVLREIDIALDCFPHNSGTTLFEHLYMGNPCITLRGRASVGTVGSTVLTHGGFEDWIADSEQEYIDIAIKLAADFDALAQTRRTMRSKMKASALMDEKGFVDRLEKGYRQMWEKWCATQ